MARASAAQATRIQLSREAVLDAAMRVADERGIGSLTMRRLAQELGVEAMTIYYYVANKGEILDGIVDLVTREIDLPSADGDWKSEVRKTALAAHEVLLRHPWASERMMSGGLAQGRLAYMESILGSFRRGGFSPYQAHLAYHAIESHIVGFTLWLSGMALPDDVSDLVDTVRRDVPREEYPYFMEHLDEHVRPRRPTDVGAFAFGLELVLDGLERVRDAARPV